MRSSVKPRRLLTMGFVDIAPWLPQCCIVSPIQAPAMPAQHDSDRSMAVLQLHCAILLTHNSMQGSCSRCVESHVW